MADEQLRGTTQEQSKARAGRSKSIQEWKKNIPSEGQTGSYQEQGSDANTVMCVHLLCRWRREEVCPGESPASVAGKQRQHHAHPIFELQTRFCGHSPGCVHWQGPWNREAVPSTTGAAPTHHRQSTSHILKATVLISDSQSLHGLRLTLLSSTGCFN